MWEVYHLDDDDDGKVELEQLVNRVENPNPEALVHGFLKKRKRSPRKRKVFIQTLALVVDRVDDSPQTGKESGPKSTSGKTPAVVCTQESISKKISIKKPTDHVEAPKTSTAEPAGEEKNPEFSTSRTILPEAFKNHIIQTGGCLETLVFVIQKGLFKTDLDPNEGRLSIPYRQVQNQFLNSSEFEQLDSTQGGIPAILVEPCLEECKMSLRNWKSNSMCALVSGWNEVCSRNALGQGVIIRLWSFRRQTDLCFAVTHQSIS
ncbi:UNVERIFIED_CONTAM: hypothetical protein Sradi_4023900 [Sesamum radiatum]|uniref:B3 domain-containing protein n=1 Tax=Sesamum radiatum TaxID=300843 RepID=A0AAW2PHN0_SESRA